MGRIGAVCAGILALASVATAEETRVATFENFTEGQSFKPSFTDPVSGIFFHDSTHPSNGFVIDYSSTQFGGGNNLTAGGYSTGPVGGWGPDFGFTGDLPLAANHVRVSVSYPGFGTTSSVTLKGFNTSGDVVAQQAGPPNAPEPFLLEITASGYEITRFQVQVYAGFSASYDDISYTVPEPGVAAMVMTLAALLPRRAER